MRIEQQLHKGIFKEVGFDALFTLACSYIEIPVLEQIVLSTSFKLAKSYIDNKIRPLYDDFSSRQLSKFQKDRLDNITVQAIKTFCRRCKEDNWNIENAESEAYLKSLFESQDHLIYQSLQDAQRLKDLLYGSYWGNLIYEHDENWDDQFFTITLLGKLSIRQFILIKMLVEGFPGINNSLSITNPIIVSEFDELAPLLWHINKGIELKNDWGYRHLGNIMVTDFAKELYQMLDLAEFVTKDMSDDIIVQMNLQSINPPSYLYESPNGNYAELPREE